MAEVFSAEDTRNSERVAIKRVLPHLARQPEFVQLFLNEARIAAQLNHPHIVQVHELGRRGQSLFLAMELVEGVNLRQLLDMEIVSGVPYRVAAQLMALVCNGLQHAHRRIGMDGRPMGIIHRDVSPQNVMLGFEGQVKLLDFGIAKARVFAAKSTSKEIRGKYYYLSPEQIERDDVDHRSDLFAVGTVLYELTTGKNPFLRATPEAAIIAIRDEPIPPAHTVRADFPRALARIIDRCLQRDRKERYAEAKEIELDLLKFLGQPQEKISPELSSYVRGVFQAQEEKTDRAFAPLPAPEDSQPTYILPEASPLPKPDLAEQKKHRNWILPAAATLGTAFLGALLLLGYAMRGPFFVREASEGAVIVQASEGVEIRLGRQLAEVGRAYAFPAGPLEVRWRCPGATVFSSRIEQVPRSEIPGLISLKCPE